MQRTNGLPSSIAPLFQSSPVPEDGCNVLEPCQRHCLCHVSILTRPGGRVQLNRGLDIDEIMQGFNPHPSRRTGATVTRR